LEKSAILQPGYRRWLDGLRGLAILAVLAYHLNLVSGGFLGVDIFLVLSGFLITTLLAEEWQRCGSISLKRFYLRRALRLFPALLTLLLACGVITLFRPADEAPVLRKEIVVAACYVANWPALHHSAMPTLAHTWSLSLEEQFYVIWPLLLYGMLRWRLGRGWMLALVGVGIVTSASLRTVLYRQHPYPDPEWMANVYRLYMGSDTRADALLVGCLVGLLSAWDWLLKSRRFIFCMGVGALVSAVVLGYMLLHSRHGQHQLYCGLLTVVALMVGVILVRLLSAPSRLAAVVLESTVLVGIGRISYALYLFHLPIISWLGPQPLGWSAPVATLLVTCLSFSAAVLSFYCVERPCLRLKQRLRVPDPIPPQRPAVSVRSGASNQSPMAA
jgi:peptidoglycan/LPS O-acetylase OafA/YrhL